MPTLEERIKNLTQDINPPARRMTEQEVMEARQRNPMAARFGSANTGFYTDEPKVLSNNEKVINTLVQLAMNAENPEEAEILLQMIRDRKNLTQDIRPTMGSGVMTDQDAQRVMQALGGNNNTMPIGSGVMSDQDEERLGPYIPNIEAVLKIMQETLAPNTRVEKRINNLRELERIKNIPQLQPLLDGFSEKVLGAGVMTDLDAQRVMQALGGNNNTMPIGSGVMSDNDAVRINKALLSGVQDPMMSNVDTSVMQPLVDAGFGNEVQVIMQMPMDSPESKAAQRRIIQGMGTGMDIDSFLMEVNNLAPKGAMSDVDAGIMGLMSAGRNEDTTVGHLAEGDVVVPPEVLEANPSIIDELEDTMLNMGVDPRSRIVDTTGELGGIASINPDTGLQEFFIKKALSKLNRARKKVTKKLAPIVSVVAPFMGLPPIVTAGLTAAAGKASGLSTKDALLGGALSYGGSKLFGGTPGSATSKGGSLFTGGGADGIGRFGKVGDFFGKVKSGISGLFGGGGQPESDIIKYDPVNQGYVNIQTGMPATASEIASLTSQSDLGRIEDLFKTLTGDDGMTRTQELLSAGYTPEQIEQFKANGTFNAYVAKARSEGKVVSNRGAVGAIQNALTGEGDGMGMMGKLGIAGLAGLLGKLAYEEAKNQKGVPLTPLTTMDPLGRYNIAAEIARQKGEAMPSRVEYGLTGEGFPALSGGRPTTSEGTIYQPPTPTMAAQGGIMAFAKGGSVAKMNEGGETEIEINIEEFPRKDGQIDGPGTETSDDIPAMLSDGEFVMTAKAVRGAGSFDLQDKNGILTLTPNGDSGRDSGTRLMYKLMDHFSKVA